MKHLFFTDFEAEREKLWGETLGELQHHLVAYGIEVEFVDMHLGSVLDHVYDSHSFRQHLQEIELCHRVSTGPFFLVSRILLVHVLVS